MADLTHYPLTIIFVASVAAFLLAIEAEHRFGSKVEEGANVSTLEAGKSSTAARRGPFWRFTRWALRPAQGLRLRAALSITLADF